jgi:uncharacterized protein YjbI with pentapeptide repeats
MDKMSNIQITSRLSGAVIFEAEIAAKYDGLPYSVRLGLAAKMAYESGADLSGSDLRGTNLSRANLSRANLSGSDLSGASLLGAKIISVIARTTRMDGHEFIGFLTDKGIIIRAGCRTMSPAEYRSHVAKEYPREDKAAETLAILDYIEARAAQVEQ